MYVPELVGYTDGLVTTALSNTGTAAERVEYLATATQRLGHLVIETQKGDAEQVEAGLRVAPFVAVAPALTAISRGETLTQSTAAAVAGNFEELSAVIAGNPDMQQDAVRRREGIGALARMRGRWSEIGILGLWWWGTAHGLRDTGMYALPATEKQDSDRRKKDNLSLATDFVITNRRDRQRVQVKTSPEPNRYHPHLAFVVLAELNDALMDRGGKGEPQKLLSFLAERDNRQLGATHEQLERIIQEAKARRALTRAAARRSRDGSDRMRQAA